MKCFYHDDLDGRAAAFCVHAWVGIKDVEQEVSFVSINYGIPFPLQSIKPNEQVWIVDYSITPEEMTALLKITKDVTWIDHHKTAIEKYKDFSERIKGIRKDGEAGCVLTWKYVHWYTDRGSGEENFDRECPELPIPRGILLTGDRDIWAWKYGDETKTFYSGSQVYNTKPDSSFWWDCMDHEIKPLPNTGNAKERERGLRFWRQLHDAGSFIEKYKLQYYAELSESIGYEVLFEGCKCLAVNVARISSDVFGDKIEKYEILLPHYHDGRQWTVSLYSKTTDVSEIAKKHGGGGHKMASGFQCKLLPWLKS